MEVSKSNIKKMTFWKNYRNYLLSIYFIFHYYLKIFTYKLSNYLKNFIFFIFKDNFHDRKNGMA